MTKQTTAEARLNALLGLTTKANEVKTRSTGRVVGVTEEEIQEFREAQGLIYFLQAPALFEYRTCKNPKCGQPFVVSRKYVSCCSYTCIKDMLANLGLKWAKGEDLEALAQDPQVYDGNEPLWVREPLLRKLQEMVSSMPPNSPETLVKESGSEVPQESIPEPLSSSTIQSTNEVIPDTQSSLTDSTTSVMKTTGATSSRQKKPKRKIIFNGDS